MAVEPDRAQRILDCYRAAFEAACARERIAARIAGTPGRFEFEGQEGASGAQILERFLLELAGQGVAAGQVLEPRPDADETELQACTRGLDRALARVRTLLVEFNSYLSGGMPYVFPTRDEVLQSRGLVVYRYPARAAAQVSAVDGRVRIAFEPGELGEVTSSGFFVPTRLSGDFEARVRYELGSWSPGPDSACLGLFAQDEPSTLRYYALVSSWGAPPSFAAQASFTGEVLDPVAIDGKGGELRLARAKGRIRAWHRARGGKWTALGERAGEAASELFVGCKIWSKVSCGGLVAELTELSIEGRPAREQGPMPAVRPDPRASG